MILISLALALGIVPGASRAPQDKRDPDSARVSADFENAQLKDILESLHLLTGIPIDLDESAKKKVDLSSRTSLKLKDSSLLDALRLVFGVHGLEVKSVNRKSVLVTAPKEK